MHSIVRRMRCEVNSAAALLALCRSPCTPLRRCLLTVLGSVDVRGLEKGRLPRRRAIMATVG